MAYQLIHQGKACKTFKTRRALLTWLSNNWERFIERPDEIDDFTGHMSRAASSWYGWRILKI